MGLYGGFEYSRSLVLSTELLSESGNWKIPACRPPLNSGRRGSVASEVELSGGLAARVDLDPLNTDDNSGVVKFEDKYPDPLICSPACFSVLLIFISTCKSRPKPQHETFK